MHLLRTNPLIRMLARDEVSNTEKAYYLVASFLMFNVAYYTGFVSGNPAWTIPSLLEGLTIALITILGMVKAFDAAGGEKSKEFVVEFTCLYVPISISTMLVVWSLFWGVSVGFRESLVVISRSHDQFAVNLFRIGADLFSFLAYVAAVGVQAITFYRMTSALARVRALKSDG